MEFATSNRYSSNTMSRVRVVADRLAMSNELKLWVTDQTKLCDLFDRSPE